MEKVEVQPGIVIYKNVLKKDLNIIDRLEESLNMEGSPFKWKQAEVGYGDQVLDHRNCYDFKYKKENLGNFNEYSKDLMLLHDQINDIIRDCLDDYCSKYHISINYIEAFNMVKYGPGQKFGYHSDDGDPYRCTVSLVGYPNDDYTGGELDFMFFDLKLKPEAGDLVIFPSSYIYSHASLPVEDGLKYSIVIMTDRHEEAHRNDSPVYKVDKSTQ